METQILVVSTIIVGTFALVPIPLEPQQPCFTHFGECLRYCPGERIPDVEGIESSCITNTAGYQFCKFYHCPPAKCRGRKKDLYGKCYYCPGKCIDGGRIHNNGQAFLSFDMMNSCFCGQDNSKHCTKRPVDQYAYCNHARPGTDGDAGTVVVVGKPQPKIEIEPEVVAVVHAPPPPPQPNVVAVVQPPQPPPQQNVVAVVQQPPPPPPRVTIVHQPTHRPPPANVVAFVPQPTPPRPAPRVAHVPAPTAPPPPPQFAHVPAPTAPPTPPQHAYVPAPTPPPQPPNHVHVPAPTQPPYVPPDTTTLMPIMQTRPPCFSHFGECLRYCSGEKIPDIEGIENYCMRNRAGYQFCKFYHCPPSNCKMKAKDVYGKCYYCPGTCIDGGLIYETGKAFYSFDMANYCFCGENNGKHCTKHQVVDEYTFCNHAPPETDAASILQKPNHHIKKHIELETQVHTMTHSAVPPIQQGLSQLTSYKPPNPTLSTVPSMRQELSQLPSYQPPSTTPRTIPLMQQELSQLPSHEPSSMTPGTVSMMQQGLSQLQSHKPPSMTPSNVPTIHPRLSQSTSPQPLKQSFDLQSTSAPTILKQPPQYILSQLPSDQPPPPQTYNQWHTPLIPRQLPPPSPMSPYEQPAPTIRPYVNYVYHPLANTPRNASVYHQSQYNAYAEPTSVYESYPPNPVQYHVTVQPLPNGQMNSHYYDRNGQPLPPPTPSNAPNQPPYGNYMPHQPLYDPYQQQAYTHDWQHFAPHGSPALTRDKTQANGNHIPPEQQYEYTPSPHHVQSAYHPPVNVQPQYYHHQPGQISSHLPTEKTSQPSIYGSSQMGNSHLQYYQHRDPPVQPNTYEHHASPHWTNYDQSRHQNWHGQNLHYHGNPHAQFTNLNYPGYMGQYPHYPNYNMHAHPTPGNNAQQKEIEL